MKKRVFVNRYKWGHAKRRKQLRRALKDREVDLISESAGGWLYEVPVEMKVH